MSKKYYVTEGNSVKVSGKYHQTDQEVSISDTDAKPLLKSGVLTKDKPKEKTKVKDAEEAEASESIATIEAAKKKAVEIVDEANVNSADIVEAAENNAADIIKVAEEKAAADADKFVNPFVDVIVEEKHATILVAAGFDTMDKLSAAKLPALEAVEGISNKDAKTIFNSFE